MHAECPTCHEPETVYVRTAAGLVCRVCRG
jgi:hypothetical protein